MCVCLPLAKNVTKTEGAKKNSQCIMTGTDGKEKHEFTAVGSMILENCSFINTHRC